MDIKTSLLCFSASFLVCVSGGQIDIPAEPGQNVTLPCRAPSSSEILVVEWTRPGLDPDFVILYRDSQSDPENQHPSFKERVELKDSQMKDGDVSVTLKNVTFTDTGTYECHVFQRQTKRRKRGVLETVPISTVHLRVSAGHREDGGDKGGGDHDGGDHDGGDHDGGDKHGHVGLAVGLPVPVLLVAAVVGSVFHRKHQSHRSKEQISVQQSVDGETVQHLA
ncbi:uncharacterized protein LOC113140781 [Mastacembelus armatus]|uniref:uncharacterized protein LOC113140781 n=1 Tax=Mastacembelus armatus TaxID=205130 RepID=UPI000E465DE3|nr:uncharacterized protein LOC113140781 [Mastacembelus armatus]